MCVCEYMYVFVCIYTHIPTLTRTHTHKLIYTWALSSSQVDIKLTISPGLQNLFLYFFHKFHGLSSFILIYGSIEVNFYME